MGDASFVDLAGHYGGRVFAFNHPSMHHSPAQNVQTLLAQLKQHLPTAARPTFDLVTHSRGGLLARELCERRAELDPGGVGLTIRRAVLVAGPNRGTILADGDNWIALADRYTNFITKLPDNAYTLTMEGILTFVKVMAHGALAGLPGLSVPCGLTAAGLPIGAQLLGRPLDEATLVRAGEVIEAAAGGRRRPPEPAS